MMPDFQTRWCYVSRNDEVYHMTGVVCVCRVQKTEVFSVRRTDEARIMLTFTYTNEIPPSAPNCLQLYNIIFKR